MTTLQRFKQFLQQNMIARVMLYLIAVAQPIYVFVYMNNRRDPIIHPYLFMSIGFYSCLLIAWAYRRKAWEQVVMVALICLNVIPMCLWGMGALMGGVFGLVFILLITLFPFLMLFQSELTFGIFLTVAIVGLGLLGKWNMEQKNKSQDS